MMTPLEARLTEENAALRAENKAQQIEIKLLREPERSGDRQPQAARRAQAKPKSKDRPAHPAHFWQEQ
jgi:hypothetical protein